MTLQDKIKEIAARLDSQTPCPISGACFSEVMNSKAGMELIKTVVLGAFITAQDNTYEHIRSNGEVAFMDCHYYWKSIQDKK